jgi:RecA/RadA recombinase
MFFSMAAAMSDRLGRSDILLGTEAEALNLGLWLPALVLRYLVQSTILPLGRIIQITGEEGSCKTALGVEMLRWHMVNGGGGAYVENEHADSPELRNSILQWNEQWIRRLEWVPTYALEEWMRAMSAFIEIAKNFMDSADGPGRTIPLAVVIDSIMATAPEGNLKKIMESGAPVLDYPRAARLISDYMKAIPALIQRYPLSIIGTNHLKPGHDYMGRPTNSVPGGKSVKFMESLELECHKSPSGDIDLLDYGGIRLRIVCRKNKTGPSRKQIVVEMLWWWQQFSDGVVRQRTGWDWDTASIELLLAYGEDRRANLWKTVGKKTVYRELMNIVPIKVTDAKRRYGYCEPLGFTADDPVHFRQMGAALERRPDLLEQIHPLLGITPRLIWQPGMDYQQMREAELSASVEQAARHYADNPVEGMPEVDADALDPEGTAQLDRMIQARGGEVGD